MHRHIPHSHWWIVQPVKTQCAIIDRRRVFVRVTGAQVHGAGTNFKSSVTIGDELIVHQRPDWRCLKITLVSYTHTQHHTQHTPHTHKRTHIDGCQH
jgi:hypothetical protein